MNLFVSCSSTLTVKHRFWLMSCQRNRTSFLPSSFVFREFEGCYRFDNDESIGYFLRGRQLTRPCFTGLPRCFSEVIDRQSFSLSIVRAICDLSRKINCATLVTDEQMMLSHSVHQKTGQTLLPFEFVVFLYYTHILTCILGVPHL